MSKIKDIKASFDFWKVARLVLLAFVMIVFILGIGIKKNSKLGKLKIQVEALKDNKYLINDKNIVELIKRYQGFDLEDLEFSKLDAHSLEQLIEKDRRIAKADIFVDKHNTVNIKVMQKSPIIRVQSNSGSYYLDKTGDYVPAVPKVAIRVPVATGYVEAYNAEEVKKKGTVLNGILQMANYINEDEFLYSLIEQMDVDRKGEITLVPKLGRNKIEFGTVDNMDDKFYRLKVYYKEGVQQVGLDKFSVLNLKYENQVVGVKK